MNNFKNNEIKVCFITAIYGNYEASCKKFAKQTITTDFICFTDNINIIKNDWIIDNNPYHYTNPSSLDNNNYVNSICNNEHTFNISKYYKQAFHNIPRLKQYDVIVWIDGTIEITYPKTSEWVLNNIHKHKIITWEHEKRGGILLKEVEDSKDFFRYSSTFWNNQKQPFQDVLKQYTEYLIDGYHDNFFKEMYPERENFGVWLTCFIAFLNNDENIIKFLDEWYLQTLKLTTQDQIGFPYVCKKLNMIPYTLPDNEIKGTNPHSYTDIYKKHCHGI
jgi:hypothetical protein